VPFLPAAVSMMDTAALLFGGALVSVGSMDRHGQ
jgi:hypothetical protein